MTVNYWLAMGGALLLTLFIGYGTFATARLLREWRPDHNLLLHPAENGLRVGVIVVCLGLGWLSGLEWAQLGWQFQQPGRQLLWGGLTGLAMAIFFYAITQRLMRRTGGRFYSDLVIAYIVPANRRELARVSLVMILVVLLEELLFRSLLLGGLSMVMPVPWLLLGLSICFGLLHSPQGLWGIVGAGLAGLVLGLLFLGQGSLLAPLVAHYLTNIFQLGQAMRLRANGELPAISN